MSTAHGKISHAHARLIMRALSYSAAPLDPREALARAGAHADGLRDELLASARRRSAERTT